jgi:hypothetical protein
LLALPQDIVKETWVLTDEAKGYAARGSPEAQLVAAIPSEGASKDALKVRFFFSYRVWLFDMTGGFCYCRMLMFRFVVY